MRNRIPGACQVDTQMTVWTISASGKTPIVKKGSSILSRVTHFDFWAMRIFHASVLWVCSYVQDLNGEISSLCLRQPRNKGSTKLKPRSVPLLLKVPRRSQWQVTISSNRFLGRFSDSYVWRTMRRFTTATQPPESWLSDGVIRRRLGWHLSRSSIFPRKLKKIFSHTRFTNIMSQTRFRFSCPN